MTDELWHSLPQAGERLESLLVEASKMYDTALFGMVWSSLKGHIDSNEDGVFKLAMSGRLEVARFLLDHGADPSRADRHGWTLGWLLFANQDRQGQDAALTPGDLPAASFLAPTSWSEERKTRGISISVPSDPNGQALQTKLVADSSGRQGTRFSSGLKRFWRPVRFRSFRQQEGIHADHPAPPKGIFYFEVTILDQKPDSNISVGFCTVDSDLERMAGWEEQSSGYHSSDGSIHHGGTNFTHENARISHHGVITFMENAKVLDLPRERALLGHPSVFRPVRRLAFLQVRREVALQRLLRTAWQAR
ncbi:hypothetical protein F5Y19DRAFT_198637 [Xylariaceae sp. FL1651]|nr:hypothetical protein F5Y19DRAFT_198637 [Xylariaceae sp. FL1651]